MTETLPLGPARADHQTTHEVEAFLYHEAELLDGWRLRDWLTLLTEDCSYLIPRQCCHLIEGERTDLVRSQCNKLAGAQPRDLLRSERSQLRSAQRSSAQPRDIARPESSNPRASEHGHLRGT